MKLKHDIAEVNHLRVKQYNGKTFASSTPICLSTMIGRLDAYPPAPMCLLTSEAYLSCDASSLRSLLTHSSLSLSCKNDPNTLSARGSRLVRRTAQNERASKPGRGFLCSKETLRREKQLHRILDTRPRRCVSLHHQ